MLTALVCVAASFQALIMSLLLTLHQWGPRFMLAAFCNPERLALLAVCGLRQLSPQERRVIVSGLVLGLDQYVYV